MKVKLSGSCNLRVMDRIISDDVPSFKIHQRPVNYKWEIIDGKFYNEKEFEVVLVPQYTGIYPLPEIEIYYFDTEEKDYRNVIIPSQEIIVEESRNEQDILDANYNMEIVIEQVFADYKVRQDDEYYVLKKKYLYYLLIIVFALLSLSLSIRLFINYFNDKKEKEGLQKVYRKIKKSTDVDELYNLFNELIKAKYNISIKANERSIIRDKIKDDKLLKDLFSIMDYYENNKEKNLKMFKDCILNFYNVMYE